MDELPIDDHGFDPADLDFDRRLRERLAPRPFSVTEGSQDVLAELRPRIVRAGRVRRATVAATIVGPLALVVGGLVLLPRLASPEAERLTVAGPPDAASSTVADDPAERVTMEATGTTAANRSPTSGTAPEGGASGAPADPTLDPSAGGTGSTSSSPTPTAPPTPSSTASTATTQPSTSVPTASTTTGTTATSTSVPGSELVESRCGSIVVVVVGSAVELVETRPDPGYRVDVKSDGPEVEVSFEGPSGHCELKAELERGRLVTSSDDEDEGS